MMTRKMQRVFFAIQMFYYASVALAVTVIMIVAESYINDHTIRFWGYSGAQYGWMFAVASFNFIGMFSSTISAQNERAGFVTLLAYIGLVYAFLGDWLIFNEMPKLLQLVGVSIILAMNIFVIRQKW